MTVTGAIPTNHSRTFNHGTAARDHKDSLIVDQAADLHVIDIRTPPIDIMKFRRRRPVPNPCRAAIRCWQIGNRCLGLQHPMVVQKIGQPGATVAPVQPPADHSIKERMAIRASDFEPIEPADFANTDTVLHPSNFARDDIKTFVKPEPVGHVEIGRRLDKLDPLPPVYNRKFRTFRRQNRRQWRGLGIASQRAVFVGKVKAEFVLVILDHLQRPQSERCVTQLS